MFNKIITKIGLFWEWYNNHKIFTWYNNQNKNVRFFISGFSAMLFGYLMVNLFDLIVNGEADW